MPKFNYNDSVVIHFGDGGSASAKVVNHIGDGKYLCAHGWNGRHWKLGIFHECQLEPFGDELFIVSSPEYEKLTITDIKEAAD